MTENVDLNGQFYRDEVIGVGDKRTVAQDTKAEAGYSIAYRPDDSPYTVLNRFDISI